MHRKGFTIIEILLALFITAILITLLSIVFNTGLRAYRQGKDLLEITRKGQLILGQMTRELVGAIVQLGNIPFKGKPNSIFFMAPVDNSSALDLCEIGYFLEDGELKRHKLVFDGDGSAFEYPETVDYEEVYGRQICDKVTGFNLRYRSNAGWDDDIEDEPYKLPQIVEVSVTIQGKYGSPLQEKTFATWIYLPNSTNNP